MNGPEGVRDATEATHGAEGAPLLGADLVLGVHFHEPDLVRYAEGRLDRALATMETSIARPFQTHLEMVKTVVALSSSSLVLSAGVVQFAATKATHALERVGYLMGAWAFFSVAVIVGLTALPTLGFASDIASALESERSKMRTRIRDLRIEADWEKQFDNILIDTIRAAGQTMKPKGRSFLVRTVISYWSFVAGLIGLAVFGIGNLP